MVYVREGVMSVAWVLDGQQEVYDLHLTEACNCSACAALPVRGVDPAEALTLTADGSRWCHCRLDSYYIIDYLTLTLL